MIAVTLLAISTFPLHLARLSWTGMELNVVVTNTEKINTQNYINVPNYCNGSNLFTMILSTFASPRYLARGGGNRP